MNHMGDTPIIVMTAKLIADSLLKSGKRSVVASIEKAVNQKGATLSRALKRLTDTGTLRKMKTGNHFYYFHSSHAEKHEAEIEELRAKRAEATKRRQIKKERASRQAVKRKMESRIDGSSWLKNCRFVRKCNNGVNEMCFYKYVGVVQNG